jgi:hypothetical protein
MKQRKNQKAAPVGHTGRNYRYVLRTVLGLLTVLPGCSKAGNQDPRDEAVVVAGIRCPDPSWLVGSIDPEKQRYYSHTFDLQNQTNESIPIKEVKSDCGCVVSQHTPREIPAHGSDGIEVSLSASRAPGEFNHAVLVKLGPSGSTSLFLKIRGTIIPNPALHASPSSLDFGRFFPDETRTRTLVVSRYDFSRVGVLRLTNTLDGCVVESQAVSNSEAILVSVRLTSASLRPGSHSGIVVVETDHPTFPSLEIPIKAEVGTVADAFLSSLLIDSIPPGGHHDFSLYRSGLPTAIQPKIAGLEFKGDPDIQVEPSSPEGSRDGMHQWRLSVTANANVGVVKKGVLRIAVPDGASDNIEVPVIVFVR